MNSSFLLTGATGFIGSHLAHSLLTLPNLSLLRLFVRSPDKLPSELINDRKVEVIFGDITSSENIQGICNGIHTVIHTAAILSGKPNERLFMQINLEGTKNIFNEALKSQSVRRFIHFSTTGVLGNVIGEPKAEDAPPAPKTVYERTKYEAEKFLLENKPNSLSLLIIRPGWVYGLGDTRTLKLFQKIKDGPFFMIGKGTQREHPIFIDDLIQGTLFLMEKQAEGIFHIVGPEILTKRELCEMVAEELGRKIPGLHCPAFIAYLIALSYELYGFITGNTPTFDRSKLHFFLTEKAYSDKKLKELGFKPQTKFKEGIKKAISWYRQRGWL